MRDASADDRSRPCRRRRRRHPPRRGTLRLRAPTPDDEPALAGFFDGLSERSRNLPLPRFRWGRQSLRAWPCCSGLERTRPARRRCRGSRRRTRWLRSRTTFDCGTRSLPRRRLWWRTTLRAGASASGSSSSSPGEQQLTGSRHSSQRSWARTEPCSPYSHRSASTPPYPGGRRGRGAVPDCSGRPLPGPSGRARPCRRHRLAAPVLRAAHRGGDRSIGAARIYRGRALPQHPHGRLHRCRIPVNGSGAPVAGVRAYTAIEDIPDTIDLCVICLPGDRVLDAADATLGAAPARCA